MPRWLGYLAGALLALAAAYSFTLIPRAEPPPFLPPAPAEIARFVLEGQETLIEMEKTAQGWRMKKPVEAAADASAVEDFLRAAATVRAEAVMTRRPEKHGDYGLSGNALRKVTIWGNGAAAPRVWLLGKPTPQGGGFLAVPEGPEVFLTAGMDPEGLRMDPDAWRDKRVFPVDEPLVRAKVREAGRVLDLAGSSETWTVNGKPAKREELAPILSNLGGLTVDRFIEPPEPANPKALGLAPPARTIEATFASGKVFLLKLGKASHGRVSAQRADAPDLFWVGEAVLPSLRTDLKKLQATHQ